ncbi:MAG: hypothetical protein IKC75_04495 [Clostridia bacterium]|nr:hypothetical protein [Clostridia bacterium]
MRKQLKLLLLVATVVALFAMAMIVGSAAFEVDGTEYATFAEAYDAVDADGTIKLTSDVTLDAKFTLTKGFTIDGANPAGGKFKITSTYSDALTFGAKINVNIKNADVVVSADRLAACGSSYRGSELAFDNCTVTCEVTRISRGTGLIMSFNNCIVDAAEHVMTGNNKDYTCTLKLTGNTTVTAGTYVGGGTNAVQLIVGTAGGSDKVTITAPGLIDDIESKEQNSAKKAVSQIYNGTFNVTGAYAFDLCWGKVEIYGGTFNLEKAGSAMFNDAGSAVGFKIVGGEFNLKNGAIMTNNATITLETASADDVVVNLDAASASLLKDFFEAEPWSTNATVNGLGVEVPKLFIVYMGDTEIGKYESLNEAYAALVENGADTIKLLDDASIIATTTLEGDLTIDGAGKKLTLSTNMFSKLTGNYNLTFKNVVLDITGAVSIIGPKATGNGGNITFQNCTITAATTTCLIYADAATVTFDSCIITADRLLEHNTAPANNNTVYVYGKTTMVSGDKFFRNSSSNGANNIIFGSANGFAPDGVTKNEISVTVNTGWLNSSEDASGYMTIYDGTTITLNGSYSAPLTGLYATKVGGTLNLYGGTIYLNATEDRPNAYLIGFESGADSAVTLNITGGTVVLGDGCGLVQTTSYNNAGKYYITATYNVNLATPGDFKVTFNETNTEAEAFFTDTTWIGTEINGEILESVERLFEVYAGEDKIGTYASFASAYKALVEKGGDRIVLLDNMTLAGASLDTGFIIDGGDNKYTVTISGTIVIGAAVDVKFVNCTVVAETDVKAFTAKISGGSMTFEGCTIDTGNMDFITAMGQTITFNNCEIDASGKNLVTFHGSNTTEGANDIFVLGKTHIVGGAKLFRSANIAGNNVTIGSEDGDDEITMELAGWLYEAKYDKNYADVYADNTITIWSGTFTQTAANDEGSTYCLLSVYVGTVNIYGGTFISDVADGCIINRGSYDIADDKLAVINITAGTFELSNGAALAGSRIKAEQFSLSCDDEIIVKLGEGSSENAAAFYANAAWAVDGMALIYITGWNAELVELSPYSFTEDWSGSFADYKAKFAALATPASVFGKYLDEADYPYFLTEEMAEEYFGDASLATLIVSDDIVVTGGFASFTIDADVTVTLRDWTVTLGTTLGTVNAGKLVLENFDVTYTASAPLFVVGDAAALEATGLVAKMSATGATLVQGAAANVTLADVLVLAAEGTTVKEGVVVDAFALNVNYAGESFKLWVANDGAFTNDTEFKGASIYVDTANEETSGLRFETVISKDALSAYAGATFKYYTLIAPMDYVAAAQGKFTVEALSALNVEGDKCVKIQAVNSLDLEDENVIKFSGTLIGLKSFTRQYAAVAMVEVCDESGAVIDTVYGEFNSADNARSAKQVADAMIADEASEYWTAYTNEQKAIVDKYAGK